MESGAKGCQVVISGKLTGQRHRTEKFKDGYIKFCGEPKLQFIRTGFAVATLKRGVIGVKVEIMDPKARLPDEVSVLTPAQARDLLPDLFAEIEAKAAAERVEAYEISEVDEAPEDEEPETVESDVPAEEPQDELPSEDIEGKAEPGVESVETPEKAEEAEPKGSGEVKE